MSEGYAFQLSTKFQTIECCRCGVTFAVSAELRSRLINSHESFYCPLGHSQRYTGKSEAEKLRDQLASAKETSEYWQQRTSTAQAEAKMASYRERAQKAAKTRLKNRIAAGVCPCCTRSFQNLARHMENQHPGFKQEGGS